MALQYTTVGSLAIPDEAFNTDDIATLVLTGTSYGGMWELHAIPTHVPPAQAQSIGGFQTEDAPRRPDLAVETAKVWLEEECKRLGLKLAHFESKNDQYGPEEAPFFAGSLALIDRR